MRDGSLDGGSDATVAVSDEQMVAILREADRDPVSVVAKRRAVSEQTIYVWRKRIAVSDVRPQGLSVARSALSFLPRKEAAVVARMGQLARDALRLPTHPGLSRPQRPHDKRGRAHRLSRAAGLQVPRQRPRRRVASGRPWPPTGANQVWAYNFVFDRCANGQQLKCLTVTDECTREGDISQAPGGTQRG